MLIRCKFELADEHLFYRLKPVYCLLDIVDRFYIIPGVDQIFFFSENFCTGTAEYTELDWDD